MILVVELQIFRIGHTIEVGLQVIRPVNSHYRLVSKKRKVRALMRVKGEGQRMKGEG